jgi:hypothetical protein
MSNIAFKYPIQASSTGKVLMVDEAEAIKQSIACILGTPIGTRYFLENYGSNVEMLTFEQNDPVLKSLLSYFVAEALQKWEKRIRLITVQFEEVGESQMNVHIIYRIKKKNVIDSFVYPFYKEIKY